MGITQINFERMLKYLPVSSLCELGDQWLFLDNGVPHHTFSKEFFQDKKNLIEEYHTIDIEERPTVSFVLDLSKDITKQNNYNNTQYDMVTDFGTLEHVVDYYMGLKNAYELCKVGGVMVISSPKIDNWPGHGFHYFSKEFFVEFSKLCKAELLFIDEFPACGNHKDGWEILAELRKIKKEFPTREKFEEVLSKLYVSVFDEDTCGGRSQIGLDMDEVDCILKDVIE